MDQANLADRYLQRIAKDWVAYFSAPDETRDENCLLYNPLFIISELVEHSPLYGWWAIQAILDEDRNGSTWDILAAGPLEDFLVHHGLQWIGDVETEAKSNRKFWTLLKGVWKNQIPDEVWDRIQKILTD